MATSGTFSAGPSLFPDGDHSTAFFAFHDREVEELKGKPYGGILGEAEADTSRTFPQLVDRKRFEEARQKAEEEWAQRAAEAAAAAEASSNVNGPGQSGRGSSSGGHKMGGTPSKIQSINFGGFEIDTWHAAPYPEEYSRNRVLYICEFCLKYMASQYVAWRHKVSHGHVLGRRGLLALSLWPDILIFGSCSACVP